MFEPIDPNSQFAPLRPLDDLPHDRIEAAMFLLDQIRRGKIISVPMYSSLGGSMVDLCAAGYILTDLYFEFPATIVFKPRPGRKPGLWSKTK